MAKSVNQYSILRGNWFSLLNGCFVGGFQWTRLMHNCDYCYFTRYCQNNVHVWTGILMLKNDMMWWVEQIIIQMKKNNQLSCLHKMVEGEQFHNYPENVYFPSVYSSNNYLCILFRIELWKHTQLYFTNCDNARINSSHIPPLTFYLNINLFNAQHMYTCNILTEKNLYFYGSFSLILVWNGPRTEFMHLF